MSLLQVPNANRTDCVRCDEWDRFPMNGGDPLAIVVTGRPGSQRCVRPLSVCNGTASAARWGQCADCDWPTVSRGVWVCIGGVREALVGFDYWQ